MHKMNTDHIYLHRNLYTVTASSINRNFTLLLCLRNFIQNNLSIRTHFQVD